MSHRFTLSASDRRAIAMLAMALCLIAAGLWWSVDKDKTHEYEVVNDTHYRVRDDATGREAQQHKLTPFPFDPNTADSVTLASLGLPATQVRNILKYRALGARWRDAEHFSQLYGLSEADYRTLLPYIRIDEALENSNKRDSSEEKAGFEEIAKAARYEKQEKLSEGEVIDVNTADTTELKKIPGVGSYYARRIVEYRERLGGYVSAEQVSEADSSLQHISKWIRVQHDFAPRTININTADFRTIVRHPYMSYDAVQKITQYRNHYGRIHSVKQLTTIAGFTDKMVDKIKRYIVVTK